MYKKTKIFVVCLIVVLFTLTTGLTAFAQQEESYFDESLSARFNAIGSNPEVFETKEVAEVASSTEVLQEATSLQEPEEAPPLKVAVTPTGTPLATDPTLPSGQSAYIIGTYGTGSPQMQVFADYVSAHNLTGNLVYCVTIAVYDIHLAAWLAQVTGCYSFTIPFPYGKDGDKVVVMQNNGNTGGVISFPHSLATIKEGMLTVDLKNAPAGSNNFGFGNFAFLMESPGSAPITTNPTLPSGQSAYVRTEFNPNSPQMAVFSDYVHTNDMHGSLIYGVNIDVYDSHLYTWLNQNTGAYTFTIPFPYGRDGDNITVLQNNVMTGGVLVHNADLATVNNGMLTVNLANAPVGTNDFGFGNFAFLLDSPAGLPILTNPTLPSGEEAFIRTECGQTTPTMQMFLDYMKSAGMQGNLVYGVDIDVFDSHLNSWINQNMGTYSFSIPFPYGKDGDIVTVLQSNVMTGGVIAHPTSIATINSGVLTVDLLNAPQNGFGFGSFGFVLTSTANAPITTNPSLPSGQSAYIRTVYNQNSPQMQIFGDYKKAHCISGNLIYGVDIDVYDSHLYTWMHQTMGSYGFTIPFPFGKTGDKVIVLQNNAMTGGVIAHSADLTTLANGMLTVNLQNAPEDTNDFGFGNFAFILVETPTDSGSVAKSPKTSDSANTSLWYMLLTASALGVVYLFFVLNKRASAKK